jgi:hypothetical protein
MNNYQIGAHSNYCIFKYLNVLSGNPTAQELSWVILWHVGRVLGLILGPILVLPEAVCEGKEFTRAGE